MDYKDFQGAAFLVGDPIGADTTNTNLGDATINGVEASGQFFFGNLGINFSVAYSDSEVESARTINESSLPPWAENDTGGSLDWLPQCGISSLTTYGDHSPTTASTARVPDPVDASVTIPNGNCFNYDPFWQVYNGQPQVQAPELSYNLSIDYEFPFAGGIVTPRVNFSHTDENYSNIIQTDYYKNDERNITDFTLAFDKDDWNVQFYIRNVFEDVYIASARAGWIGYGVPRTYGVRARMNF
jgi:iron complex outermembrane receptor protein